METRAFDPRVRAGTVVCEIGSEHDVESAVAGSDAVVILVDHDEFLTYDYEALNRLLRQPGVWVDARHVLTKAPTGSVAMGLGRPAGRITPQESRDDPFET